MRRAYQRHEPTRGYLRAVRDAGRKVDTIDIPAVGDACRLCGRPITCVGLTTCSDCGRSYLPHGPRLWRKDKPSGVCLEPTCDSMYWRSYDRDVERARADAEDDDA
jgi:hypothetical protein